MKYDRLEQKIWNKDLHDIPKQTLEALEPVYDAHKKECLDLMLYMTKHEHPIEAIREASSMYDRAIIDLYNIKEEQFARRAKSHGYSFLNRPSLNWIVF